jgi:uncharacterized membrane protein YbhN (UPF0104 family)
MSRTERSSVHSWVSLAIRLLIGVGLLVLALWLSRDQLAEVAARRPDLGLFGLAFGIYFGGVLLAYYRWYLLVRALGLPFTVRDSFRLGMIGTLFNMVIPGAIGGDFVKAAYFAREQARKGRAIASIVIDRIVGLIGLFVLAAITGAWSWPSLGEEVRGVVIAAWIALGVTTLLLILCFAINPHGPVARRLNRSKRGAKLVRELHETGVAYRRRPGVVLLGIAGGATTHFGNVLAFVAVSHALYPSAQVPSLTHNLMIVPLVLFSTAIPLPFSGLGASEGVSTLLFLSVDFRGGAMAMLGFRLLQFIGAGLGAIVYAANRRQVRDLSSEADHTEVDADVISLEPSPSLPDR